MVRKRSLTTCFAKNIFYVIIGTETNNPRKTESVDVDMELEDELVAVNATNNSSIEAMEQQIFELNTNAILLDEDSNED